MWNTLLIFNKDNLKTSSVVFLMGFSWNLKKKYFLWQEHKPKDVQRLRKVGGRGRGGLKIAYHNLWRAPYQSNDCHNYVQACSWVFLLSTFATFTVACFIFVTWFIFFIWKWQTRTIKNSFLIAVTCCLLKLLNVVSFTWKWKI